MKWLIVTVGGSCGPVVSSINTLNPDRVIFVCSKDTETSKGSFDQVLGEGMVCTERFGKEPSLPNIPKQTGLSEEQYSFSIYDADPDDLSQCYAKIIGAIEKIRQTDEHPTIYCDYTGGTKSMSTALAMAAIDDGDVRIYFVTGMRTDLTTVVDGTHFLKKAKVQSIIKKRLEKDLEKLFQRYDYAAANKLLERHLAANHYLASEHEPETIYQNWIVVCRAFDAWDRFDHKAALDQLSTLRHLEEYNESKDFLGKIVHKASAGEAWQAKEGCLLVTDLLANAKRRAAQGRYDDAIGRHYRAAELVAQIYLWNQHKINTSEVPKEKLPDQMKPGNESKDTIKLGLFSSWKLAAGLDSSIAEWFNKWEDKLQDALKNRNHSLFAHGTKPITEEVFKNDIESGLAAFTIAALDQLVKIGFINCVIHPPDFPTTLPR